jgi:ribosomal protein S12 methylthiotransferase
MYAYPGRVSERLIRAMAEIPEVVPYLDMPLQHGSVAMLKRMRRPANMTMVRRTLAELRAAMPEIALRTSLIVGFPSETDEEFAELLDFVREVRFDHLGVFTYSPQERTPAAALPGQRAERVKRTRRAAVMKIQQAISLEKNRAFVGRELEVLVEAAPAPDLAIGRSYRDAPEVDGSVRVLGPAPVGEVVRVRITDAEPYDLVGLPAAVGT